MKKFKEETTGTILELASLLNAIDSLINKDYIHVNHLLSKDFKSNVKTAINKVEAELNEREY